MHEPCFLLCTRADVSKMRPLTAACGRGARAQRANTRPMRRHVERRLASRLPHTAATQRAQNAPCAVDSRSLPACDESRATVRRGAHHWHAAHGRHSHRAASATNACRARTCERVRRANGVENDFVRHIAHTGTQTEPLAPNAREIHTASRAWSARDERRATPASIGQSAAECSHYPCVSTDTIVAR
eukprot:TRINITY_DN924_c0_g1_i1.p2 TRINITY_DN924_c0_g1~~TRINITY_DN924_c0_g1_i1.p2  ORF type:complete len:187 (+),score=47.48 TRINITY_DN924_c0_g1_i1:2-562(+)